MFEGRARIAAVGAVLAAATLTGCSDIVSGTPQADPDQRLATPAAVDATCQQYAAMNDPQRKAVIDAIAEQNPLVRNSPELWISVAAALCTFADPQATVRATLEGEGVR